MRTYSAKFLETGNYYRFQVLAFTETGDGFHTEALRQTTRESASSRLNRFQSGGVTVPAADEGSYNPAGAEGAKLRRPSISGRHQPMVDEANFTPHEIAGVNSKSVPTASTARSFVKKIDPSEMSKSASGSQRVSIFKKSMCMRNCNGLCR